MSRHIVVLHVIVQDALPSIYKIYIYIYIFQTRHHIHTLTRIYMHIPIPPGQQLTRPICSLCPVSCLAFYSSFSLLALYPFLCHPVTRTGINAIPILQPQHFQTSQQMPKPHLHDKQLNLPHLSLSSILSSFPLVFLPCLALCST